jgi:hypothetical protein
MAELVDALDLGSSFSRSEGSSPFVRILSFKIEFGTLKFLLHPLANLQNLGRGIDC